MPAVHHGNVADLRGDLPASVRVRNVYPGVPVADTADPEGSQGLHVRPFAVPARLRHGSTRQPGRRRAAADGNELQQAVHRYGCRLPGLGDPRRHDGHSPVRRARRSSAFPLAPDHAGNADLLAHPAAEVASRAEPGGVRADCPGAGQYGGLRPRQPAPSRIRSRRSPGLLRCRFHGRRPGCPAAP
ncbi:hypothetical protein D9M72_364060 [compost metagenome]